MPKNADPFADDEVEDTEPPKSRVSDPWEESPNDDGKPEVNVQNPDEVSLTFKSGAGYGAPWVVLRLTTPAEALEAVGGDPDGLNATQVLVELFKRVVKANKMFASEYGGESESGRSNDSNSNRSNGSERRGKPAGASRGRGTPPDCEHGEMVWKSGVNKTTKKAYEGWYCDGDVDWDDKCRPVYPK